MKTSDSFSNTILQEKAQKRANKLRSLYSEYVKHPDGNWKLRAEALVPAEIAGEVAEAMDFIGSRVDERRDLGNGLVFLRSDGYYAHSL